MNDMVRYAAEKWSLNDLRTIYEHSEKAVYRADSAVFGAVILKWDRHCAQLLSEYTMLARLNGETACKVYEFEEQNSLLLEECILPGTVLREEPSLEQRVRAFEKVFRAIHTPANDGETYLDWLYSVNEYCRNNPVEPELAHMTAKAHDICKEIFSKYTNRVLLHGDLHHDNLLLRNDGTYAMIDPKGVIGPAIFDLPRYILNEIDTAHTDPDDVHIENVICLLSEHLGYPADDISKLYFMETVLANIWSCEDNEPVNRDELALASNILSKFAQT